MNKVSDSLYEKPKPSRGLIALNVLISIMVIVIIFEIWFSISYSGIYVVQSSMYPTLIGAEEENEEGGDYLYAAKHAKPKRGDIVVVRTGKNSTIIKRLIALGGDYVKLDKGKLYIKYKGESEFKLVEEDYVQTECNDPYNISNTFPTVKLPAFYGGDIVDDSVRIWEGYMFLLGDNRNVSRDSRQSGAYPESDLFGVITDWSFKHKDFFTSLHTFLTFDLPEFFKIK